MATKIRVLIVDDQSLIRVGIQTLLSRKPDIEVVGQAGDGEEALRLVAALDPDVILMDIRMPGMDGVAATRELVARHARAGIIILTTFDDDANVFGALAAGARGYLLKDTDHKELAEAIRVVASGRALIHPEIAGQVLREFSRLASSPAQAPATRPRPSDDFRMIGQVAAAAIPPPESEQANRRRDLQSQKAGPHLQRHQTAHGFAWRLNQRAQHRLLPSPCGRRPIHRSPIRRQSLRRHFDVLRRNREINVLAALRIKHAEGNRRRLPHFLGQWNHRVRVRHRVSGQWTGPWRNLGRRGRKHLPARYTWRGRRRQPGKTAIAPKDRDHAHRVAQTQRVRG